MAEGTSGNLNDIVDQSPVHSDEDSFQNSAENCCYIPDSTVCWFFLQGNCRYGDKCWFKHDEQVKMNFESTQQCDKNLSECSETSSPEIVKIKKKCKSKYNFQHKNSIPSKEQNASSCGNSPPDWLNVNAPEFVPKTALSYADSLKCNINSIHESQRKQSGELCSYFMLGNCPFAQCPFIHGDVCELCNVACLNPNDKAQRETHIEYCSKEIEKDMELSFAIQRSMNKTCGICMDVIMEKEPVSERRFGILENCYHIFCVSCIRKWRQVKNFDGSQLDSDINPKVTRSCPECRVPSDFVTPSLFWVDAEDEKKKLISDYKEALSKKPCKYFKKGEGTCPFGGACFYLHAKPDGTVVKLPPPRRRRRQNQDGEIDIMEEIYLWSFMEARDEIYFDLNADIYIISDDIDDSSE
ncbi:unnamed protein product [Larinioides sclopetarius]|uniref:RING-type E3 ubiquitin transferase n=1 Tax=Larinioides sclopetarius TaxID=280406 RepID=A0AAV2A5Z9_9ARAC